MIKVKNLFIYFITCVMSKDIDIDLSPIVLQVSAFALGTASVLLSVAGLFVCLITSLVYNFEKSTRTSCGVSSRLATGLVYFNAQANGDKLDYLLSRLARFSFNCVLGVKLFADCPCCHRRQPTAVYLENNCHISILNQTSLCSCVFQPVFFIHSEMECPVQSFRISEHSIPYR